MHALLLWLGLAACSDPEPETLSAAPARPGAAAPADAGPDEQDAAPREDAPAKEAAPVVAPKAGAPAEAARPKPPPPRTAKAQKRAPRAEPEPVLEPVLAPTPPEPAVEADHQPAEVPRLEPDPAEAWLASLRDSAITYNRPDTVPFGEVFDVELFIDISGDTAVTEAALAEAREGNPHITGETHTALAPTGNEVEVSLLGSNADIDALEPERQRLTTRAPGRWQWRITPTSPDDIVLKLHVLAIQPGHASGLRIQSYEDTIVVRITTTQKARIWLSDNWEWAWTFFVAPLGGFIWARFRRRRKDEAPPSAEGEA